MKPYKPRDIDKLYWSEGSSCQYEEDYYFYDGPYCQGKGAKFLENKRLMCPKCKFVFKRHWLGPDYSRSVCKIVYKNPICPHCKIDCIKLHPSIKIPKKNKR